MGGRREKRKGETVVAFTIRRPWPQLNGAGAEVAGRTGGSTRRWLARGPFWRIAGCGLYWPAMVTVWHAQPWKSEDADICWPYRRGWKLHVHHWVVQFNSLQKLRRRLLTRCAVCGGRSTREHPVNRAYGIREKSRWWQGEIGQTHSECGNPAPHPVFPQQRTSPGLHRSDG